MSAKGLVPDPGAIRQHAALFLDLDGTLIDTAARPDAVVVPPDLPDILRQARLRLCGALAIVSGRRLGEIEALLGRRCLAMAAEHGAVYRLTPRSRPISVTTHQVPAAWRHAARALAGSPGLLYEAKSNGFVLHYRAMPHQGPVLLEALERIVAADPRFAILTADMAWEVRPAGVHKGMAVVAFMETSPFKGRMPVFVGDDVTDEDGMRAARAMGGLGLKVGVAFAGPATVRAWLQAIANDA